MKNSPDTQTPTSPDFQRGEYLYPFNEKRDSAFIYFNNVTENSKDSVLVAMAYAYMAMIQQNAGDFYGVQESALAGIKLVHENDPPHHYCLASLYNMMGRSNMGLKNYDAATKYFTLALNLQTDDANRNTYRNNIAVALREKGDYSKALQILLSIEVQQDETVTARARRITNLASLKWKADNNFNPVPDLHLALDLRIREKDLIGTTASYKHLSDYYLANREDSALFYARKMYATAQRTTSAEDRINALRKLTLLVPLQEARSLFERYESLNDSMQSVQSAAKNQFAVIRYESEKSKAENLLLQEDNAQKKLQILHQRLWVYGSIIMAILLVGVSFWQYRKKRRRMELRSQAAIRESQLKISQKVHDTVANGLYRIMNEIEHHENIEKEPLLDRIEDLYERSRDISYEPPELSNNSVDRINEILTSFSTSATKISAVGNQESVWSGIESAIVKELEQVLQELLVNMRKHSGARHAVLQFARPKGVLEITYKDDGRGFQANFKKGNGLTSTENRINQIGGQIIFTGQTARGAEIKIVVPISIQ